MSVPLNDVAAREQNLRIESVRLALLTNPADADGLIEVSGKVFDFLVTEKPEALTQTSVAE